MSDDTTGPPGPDWPLPGNCFVRNHTDATVTLATAGYDLVSDAEVNRILTVQPGGSALVREVD